MTVSTVEFMNETEFENDQFSSVEENAVSEDNINLHSVLGYYLIIVTIMNLVLVLAVLAGNLFLAVVILRFKRLKAIRTNIYILHLSLINVVYYLCSPLFYTICHIVSRIEVASILVLQTQLTLLMLYLTFGIGLALDWYLIAKKPQLISKVENNYKYIFMTIYFTFLLEWTISFIYSEEHHIARAGWFLLFYLTYIIALAILNILKKKLDLTNQSQKTEYAFPVANIIIFSFLPMFLYHLLYQMVTNMVAVVLLFLEIIPKIIEVGHPIWIIYLLGSRNKYFKIAYYKSFRRSIQDYEDEDLDVVSENEYRTYLTTNMVVSANSLQDDV